MQNKLIKKIFVCEFITGGGLCAEQLPESLIKEGALMRDALLRDLSQLPYQVYTTADARLKPPNNVAKCIVVQAKDDIWKIWETQIKRADAVWIIAPETDGLLHCLTQMAVRHGKKILGCGLVSVKVTSEKLKTCIALQKAGISTIPTHTYDDWQKSDITWLAKPNDGAGCGDTACFDNCDELQNWLLENGRQHTHVIQAFQEGTHASISCVMHKGNAEILSCNTQLVTIENKALKFKGCIVNGMKMHWQQFQKIAKKIAHAMPDLAGYVGIDVIVKGNEVCVVEINPRLTTSYAGLNKATGVNLAELIIDMLTKPDFVWPKIMKNKAIIHA
jgi:predicted ATP-grasp superfamily ATP-dependent carboligase